MREIYWMKLMNENERLLDPVGCFRRNTLKGAIIISTCIIFAFICLKVFHTMCLWSIVLGHSCPGCGITRACLALISGNLRAAWDFNPLIMIVAPVLLYSLLKRTAMYFSNKRLLTKGEHILLSFASLFATVLPSALLETVKVLSHNR